MSRALGLGEIKALTRQLVAAVGGVEAAGLELSISHQRVSQYQNPNNTDVMPLLSILALEAVAERPIITGAAARAIETEAADDIHAAVVAAVNRASLALKSVHEMDADRHRDVGEIREVQAATAGLLDAVQQLHDTATSLQPTRLLRAVGE